MSSAPGRVDAAAPTEATGCLHDVVAHPRGPFTIALCTGCGWAGPARRSLYRVGQDAETHRLLAAGIGSVPALVG